MFKAFSDTIFVVIVLAVIPVAPAHAYLDGATISMILQAATGAVASVLIFGKVYWAKVKAVFKRSKSNNSN